MEELTVPACACLCAQVSLMTENGDTRDDLNLPSGTEEADKLAVQLKADFADGKDIVVSVTKSMDIEMIQSMKVRAAARKGWGRLRDTPT